MSINMGVGIAVALAVLAFALLIFRAQHRKDRWAKISLHDDTAPSAPERREPPAGANFRSSITAPARLTTSPR